MDMLDIWSIVESNVIIDSNINCFNVEIINPIPDNDLEYIISQVDLYKAGNNIQLKELGSGAFGSVFEYKDYAIKIFRNSTTNNSDYDILKVVQDINIFPKLYCYRESDFMITEKINGVTLSALWNENDLREAFIKNNRDIVKLMSDIQTKVHECAKRGICLMDIHGENIMVTNEKFMFIDLGNCITNSKMPMSKTTFNEQIFRIYNVDYSEVKV